MGVSEYTVVMPMYGHSDFTDLAVRSIARYSALPVRLVLVVEPANTRADETWIENLPAIWPHPLKVIRNEQRLGYYASVNRGVKACETEAAVIFTTDQVASPDWDRLLLEHLAPKRFVTGRLVESGANLIADGNIRRNFGYVPTDFRETAFVEFCRTFRADRELGVPRHYIPMAFFVRDFLAAGMFKEVWDTGSAKTHREDFYFFLRCFDAGYSLVEVQRPLTYHFQSGSRKGRFQYSMLNALYPYGLKYVHRWLTGYVSLYDALLKRGARARLDEESRAAEAGKGEVRQ